MSFLFSVFARGCRVCRGQLLPFALLYLASPFFSQFSPASFMQRFISFSFLRSSSPVFQFFCILCFALFSGLVSMDFSSASTLLLPFFRRKFHTRGAVIAQRARLRCSSALYCRLSRRRISRRSLKISIRICRPGGHYETAHARCNFSARQFSSALPPDTRQVAEGFSVA